jgi:hypothetical protein
VVKSRDLGEVPLVRDTSPSEFKDKSLGGSGHKSLRTHEVLLVRKSPGPGRGAASGDTSPWTGRGAASEGHKSSLQEVPLVRDNSPSDLQEVLLVRDTSPQTARVLVSNAQVLVTRKGAASRTTVPVTWARCR